MSPIENVRGDQCITFHVHIQLFLFFHPNLCDLMSCIICSWSHAAVRNGYCRRNKKLGILGIEMGFLMEKFFFVKKISKQLNLVKNFMLNQKPLSDFQYLQQLLRNRIGGIYGCDRCRTGSFKSRHH